MGCQSKEEVTQYWKTAEMKAFESLKRNLMLAPILKSADYCKQFVVETDANFEGLGAVLPQEYDGWLHPVAYGSRGLQRSECNMNTYSSWKLELLALKWAVTEHFKHCLACGKFVVVTDNNQLAHLETTKLSAVESKWLGDLNWFSSEVTYRPGKENANADTLSRRPHEEELEDDEEVCEVWEKVPVGRVVVLKLWEEVTVEQMRREQKSSPEVGTLWVKMIG